MCRALFSHLQPHFWNRIHLILYGAGKWKHSHVLRRCCASWRGLAPPPPPPARLQPPITTVMYDFHIKTAQLYWHLEATFFCLPERLVWMSEVCSSGGNLFVHIGKITGKGGEVVHVMSRHCWRKGGDEEPVGHDTLGFQEATFVLQQRNGNVASMQAKGLKSGRNSGPKWTKFR